MAKKETWYPTLEKTVWVLSQLHDFVKPAIFEDIAQEAVSLCRHSLVAAAELIRVQGAPMSSLDGSLFLVRHLLILKEVTNNLDLAHRDLEDLGGRSDTFTLMFSKTTSLLPNALFASLGMPKTDESISETKHSVDHDLREACEAVIAQCTDPICDPLRQWVVQLQDFAASTRKPQVAPSASRSPSQQDSASPPLTSAGLSSSAPPSLAAQPWAQKAALEALSSDFRAACAGELRTRILRLRLYLEDERTAGVLAGHVRARILEAHGTWRDAVWGVLSGEPRNAVTTSAEAREIVEEACREGETTLELENGK
ncbi:hypothetical protein HGRIS_003128 [Hohenbuehelia grisea]|uniref:Conserved oligomeric Golgi complex subunit 3 C-terminal domain-containing protein n=1 Tax=Hohenbuehelia grisea TaxID=104357 RepID=A0ABR3JMS5_9AGAR